jgi:hypothetical protein
VESTFKYTILFLVRVMGAKSRYMDKNKTANMGINIIKKVVVVIYRLKSIIDKRFTVLIKLSGIKMNNDITSVITNIDKPK